jgi:hypothetical protein
MLAQTTPDIREMSVKWERRSLMVQIPLSDAIAQLRDELRKAVLEGRDKDIVFVPNSIELELGVTFGTEAQAGGGFKLLAFLDVSAGAKASRSSAHKLKLSLDVTDRDFKPLKVLSTDKTER